MASLDTPRKHPTLASDVYAALKVDIVSLKFPPGSMVQEEALAQRLGVSRTPVREALRRLEQEGLIKTVPKRGSFVAGVSLSDVREVLQVRLA